MCQNFAQVSSYEILADERNLIFETLCRIYDEDRADVVFTIGGTGFSPRDVNYFIDIYT
jgi:molybdopterin biosynthesis enzyme MoaB